MKKIQIVVDEQMEKDLDYWRPLYCEATLAKTIKRALRSRIVSPEGNLIVHVENTDSKKL